MNPLYNEYRQQAEYSMRMAEQAPTEDMRADWLRLAAKWLAMVPHREANAKERFETAQNRTIGRTDTSTSH